MTILNERKVAEFKVERMPVYASSDKFATHQTKTMSVWELDVDSIVHGRVTRYQVQIGNGRRYWCHSAEDHATRNTFHFEDQAGRPQRWEKA